MGRRQRLLRAWAKLMGADTCQGQVGDRSYVVKVVDGEYRRSRRHVIVVQEDPFAESPDLVEAALRYSGIMK